MFNSREFTSRGVPTFFLALCHEASMRRIPSYAVVGRELYRHALARLESDFDSEDSELECDRLAELIEMGDDAAVLRWFMTSYPGCMALVPARRRQTFIQGVYDLAKQLC